MTQTNKTAADRMFSGPVDRRVERLSIGSIIIVDRNGTAKLTPGYRKPVGLEDLFKDTWGG